MKKWKCMVCGQVFEGDEPPVPCPICGAGVEAFELVETPGPSLWRCTVCGQVFEGEKPPVPCPVCGAGEAAFERVEIAQTDYRQDTDDRFLLIGGGVAALEAAKAIRKRNATATITIISGENHHPYNRPALSDVLADGLSFANLVLEEPGYYDENTITVLTGALAKTIHTGAKEVELENGDRLPYTKLLIATGARPFNPIKSGAGAIPVKVLRCYDDAEELARNARGHRLVLVGGGILGLEAALALREIGCAVTVVELADRLLPLQADETASALLQQKLEALGIGVLTGISVASATEAGVVLSDGSEMAADMVLASLGVRSEVSLAIGPGLELGRGIVVDEFMHTSHSDIWAAGDCAEFNGKVVALVGAATSMGAVAGASMAGDEATPYTPFVPATALEFSGFSLFSVGDVNGKADETVTAQNNQTGAYKRLSFRKQVLTGALFVGGNPGAKAVSAVSSGAAYIKALELLA